MICMMNPATGRERELGHGTLQPAAAKRVAVVGGGPAGLKVASVAAARGHQVTLYERSTELGGHLNVLKRFPTRQGWQITIDNLRRAAERSGVEMQLGAEADPMALNGAEVVVCATGSRYDRTGFTPFRPEREGIPGAEQTNVLALDEAAERALADPSSLGRRVVIIDETGFYLPLGLAEIVAGAGGDVEVISRQAGRR